MTTVGAFAAVWIVACSPPIKSVNSSLTILMICCPGERLSNTSAPTARALTVFKKSLTTLKLTSASSKASRTSLIISFTSASVTFPLRRIFVIAFWRRSVKPSNAILLHHSFISHLYLFLITG